MLPEREYRGRTDKDEEGQKNMSVLISLVHRIDWRFSRILKSAIEVCCYGGGDSRPLTIGKPSRTHAYTYMYAEQYTPDA